MKITKGIGMEASPVIQITPGKYAIICVDCDTQLGLGGAKLPQRGQQLEILCPCGKVLKLVCERRRFMRKEVQLNGYIIQSEDREERHDIEVLDLSLGGIRFRSQRDGIEIGNIFTARFFLDGVVMKWLAQEIIVRNIHDDQTIGAEFVDQAYNVDIDLHLTTFNITD